MVQAASRNNLGRLPSLALLVSTSALAFVLSGPGAAPLLAASAQDPALAAGIRQVDEGDFEGAVATLGSVVERLSATGGHGAAQACLYLGIAHLALDQRDAARGRFRQALGHDATLRLDAARFSPKLLAAFEEARREREAEARAAAPSVAPEAKKSRSGQTLLLGGAAVAAGTGVALALRGGNTGSGEVSLVGARFGTLVLECPNGTAATLLPVAIDLSAENGSGRDVTIGAVSAVLFIVASPAVPGEIGFSSNPPATVAPTTLRPGTNALRVQTTLTCANGEGDASRFNEWKGRVTLTAGAAHTVETVDTMRVNLP